MTIEEKAKAYDEALDRMKHVVIVPKNEKALQALKETIFPELRESEDEKNANALIRLLNDERVSVLMTYEARQQWLDWLERKKIPSVSFNPALGFDPGSAVVYHNDESEDKRIIQFFAELATDACGGPGQEYYEELGLNYDKVMTWLKKQKELMPPINVDPCDASWDAYYQRGLNKGYELGLEAGRKEQKPVECIEDSVKFEEGFKVGRESGLRDGQKYVLNNLDSYGLCKPAEWSEEDEEMRLEAIRVLVSGCERYRKESGCLPGWHKVIDWLKSLRPGWKPTEEQMEALAYASKVLSGDPFPRAAKAGEELEHLREHLKKL